MAAISFVVSRNLFTAVSDCRERSSATVNSISFCRKLPAVIASSVIVICVTRGFLQVVQISFTPEANFKRTVVTFVEKLRLLSTGPFHKVSVLDTVLAHLQSVSQYQFNWTLSFRHRLPKRLNVCLVPIKVYNIINDDSVEGQLKTEINQVFSKLPCGKSDIFNL